MRYAVFNIFFFSSRRRHTRLQGDWSSDVCSSDLGAHHLSGRRGAARRHPSRGGPAHHAGRGPGWGVPALGGERMTRWLGKVALLAGLALAGGAGAGGAAQGSLAEAAERTPPAGVGPRPAGHGRPRGWRVV